jgi:hypothetical protein
MVVLYKYLLGISASIIALSTVLAQTVALPAASQTIPVPPTLSLGEPDRTVRLEADDPDTKYQNGFFFNGDRSGHILIRNKDGHLIGDLNLRPQETSKVVQIPFMHDVALFKDGSIVASWIFMLPHDQHRYHHLMHYDPQGNFLESIDLGEWRAIKVCVADDKSIWTLSGKDEFGHEVYSPEEGVVRNYKFGSGLLRAGVPRATFPSGDGDYSYATKNGAVAIDCSGTKIHVLTGLGQWIEYTPGADFTLKTIDPFTRSTFGDYWRMVGFAYLDDGHVYGLIHSFPGDPFRRMLAELLRTSDGEKLQWVEIPPQQTIPANTARQNAEVKSDEKPKEPIAVNAVLGADHEDGDRLVYRTTQNESVLWSTPRFGSVAAQPNAAQPASR